MDQAAFSRAGGAQARGDECSLRPAVARLFFETSGRTVSGFGMPPMPRTSRVGRLLTTFILALYPAFAAAAVVVLGLMLAGSGT
ncbi:MAG: hypothetical protein KF723_04505 [Rhizobiaceae bacterium]|nr:hypothetical protein [Rhizobiaceae bacterium]